MPEANLGRAMRHINGQHTQRYNRLRNTDGSHDTITISRRGSVEDNIPRWVVMYLAQEMGGLKLREVAGYLGLKRTGSIPMTIAKLKLRMKSDAGLSKLVGEIKRQNYT